MKLIYKHNQERHFKIIRYPDGQQNVELDLNYFNDPKQPVTMQVSIRNFMELEVFQCLWSALVKHDFLVEEIEFMYLTGMRSDRSFALGQPNYFRDILAPYVCFGRHRIKVFFPHSQIGLKYLRGAESMYVGAISEVFNSGKHLVIGADANACWSETPIFHHFVKKRTDKGIELALSKASYSKIESTDEPIMVVDDLCDGGATFIAVAEYLQKEFPDRKRYLFVAHGLFTKGVDHVTEHFDEVITTNSYQEFGVHEKLSVIDIWR